MKTIPISIVATFLFAFQDIYYNKAFDLDPQVFISVFTFSTPFGKLAQGYFFRTHHTISQFLEVGYLVPFVLRNVFIIPPPDQARKRGSRFFPTPFDFISDEYNYNHYPRRDLRQS